MQELEPLGVNRSVENAHAGSITARSIEACDKANSNGVVDGRKDNRYCGRRRLGRYRCRLTTGCNDYINMTPGQVRRLLGQSTVLIVGPAIFNANILPFNIADFLEALVKCRQ